MGARVRCAARRRGSEPARGLSALHEDVVRRRTPSVATGRNEKEGRRRGEAQARSKLRSKWQVNARFAARNRDRITFPLYIEDDVFLHRLDLSKTNGRPKVQKTGTSRHLPGHPTHTQAAGAGGCRGTRARSCFEGLSDVGTLAVANTKLAIHSDDSWAASRRCFASQ